MNNPATSSTWASGSPGPVLNSDSNSGLWDRLKWGLQLLFACQGIGWEHEPKSILPPHPNLTHTQFIKSRLLQLAVTVLQNDIMFIIMSTLWDPCGSKIIPYSQHLNSVK
jgi:hypothetical protein